MSASPREELVAAFLRFIEERGSGAYGALARARPPPPPPAMNLLCRKSRLDWRPHKEAEARQGAGKARDAASLRRHFRVGFMTMPASQERAPRPCAGGMAPRSLSCHAVGGGPASGDVAAGPGPGPGDRPAPTKPARHPGTRLSAPADPRRPEQPPGKKGAVAVTVAAGGIAEPRDGGRKVPPQKPARSPHTQLSAPFEEPPPPPPGTGAGAGAGAGGGGRTATSAAPPRPRAGPDPPPAAAEEEEEEEDEEEPVYIEMVGDVCRGAEEAWDEGEAIYEEMKYPAAGEMPPLPPAPRGEGGPGAPQHRPPPALLLPTTTTTVPPPPLPGIPPPFPNLLQHRPPLLAFPPGKAHKAAAGTAAAAGTEPSKLPVPLHAKEAPAATVTAMVTAAAAPPPGRARSHSTPLQPCAHAKAEAPGATAAARPPPPSLLPVPQPGRDKASLPAPPALAYAVVYQAVKVTAVLPPAAEAVLPPAATAAARLPAAAARPEPPLGLLWTYPAASGGARRPPAYDSLRGSGRARGEDDAGGGWALPRKGPYGGRKGKEAEKAPEAARGWPGGGEAERDEAAAAAALAPSGIPLRAPGGRTGLPVPCQTFPACHRNGDFPGGYRLGRSASTSGVRQAARPRESAAPPRGPPWGAPRGAVAAAAIAAAEPPPAAAAAAAGAAAAARERDGKLLEVIERKRCVCKEIKARHRPERGLCKQESMPILPSWRRGAEARKAGTPPCRRQHTVLWDTAI